MYNLCIYMYIYVCLHLAIYICFWWLSNCCHGLLRAPKVIDTVMHCYVHIITYNICMIKYIQGNWSAYPKNTKIHQPFWWFLMYLLDFVHFETDQIFFTIGWFRRGYVSNLTTEDLVRCGSIGGGENGWVPKRTTDALKTVMQRYTYTGYAHIYIYF